MRFYSLGSGSKPSLRAKIQLLVHTDIYSIWYTTTTLITRRAHTQTHICHKCDPYVPVLLWDLNKVKLQGSGYYVCSHDENQQGFGGSVL